MFLRHNDSPLYIKRAPHGLFLNHFHAATAAWSLITASTRLSAFRYCDFTSTVKVGAFVHLAFLQSHCSYLLFCRYFSPLLTVTLFLLFLSHTMETSVFL